MDDWMHDMHLGAGQVVSGSVLVDLCGGRTTSAAKLDVELEIEWTKLNSFTTAHRLSCSQPQFTAKNLGITSTGAYPGLSSKAYHCKIILFWLAHRVQEHEPKIRQAALPGMPPADQIQKWRLISTCLYALVHLHHLMDKASMFFTTDEAATFAQSGTAFLTTWMALSRLSLDQGLPNYNITPKFHYLAHIIYTVQAERINPKFMHCYQDEDFVGRVSRIAGKTHPRKLGERTMGRYLIWFWAEWVNMTDDL
jgi:hypothetical protein